MRNFLIIFVIMSYYKVKRYFRAITHIFARTGTSIDYMFPIEKFISSVPLNVLKKSFIEKRIKTW